MRVFFFFIEWCITVWLKVFQRLVEAVDFKIEFSAFLHTLFDSISVVCSSFILRNLISVYKNVEVGVCVYGYLAWTAVFRTICKVLNPVPPLHTYKHAYIHKFINRKCTCERRNVCLWLSAGDVFMGVYPQFSLWKSFSSTPYVYIYIYTYMRVYNNENGNGTNVNTSYLHEY